MSDLQTIKASISTELDQLNQRIRKQLASNNPLMDSVIENYLRTKGKQIRPILVILVAKMFGNVDDKTLSAAAAVELLHNASLIHDDVVDNSKMRRNEPTINAIWDNHISVLVGDFFVSSAMQQAIATGDIRIIDALCYLGKLLSLGELDQIYNARFHKLNEDGYIHIIDYKTASLFVACAKMGCYSSGASDADTAVMAEFARLLGLCFQIKDDIFDYYAESNVGKPTGNDLREGKITLPLLHVLINENAPLHAEMLALSQKEQLTEDDIATLTSYAIDNGGIEYAYQKMRTLRDEAAQLLNRLPSNEATASLIYIFDSIIARI